MASCVVYRALVEEGGQYYCYFGSTGRRFKDRYYDHTANFNNPACRKRRRAEDGDKKQGTALSEKIWEIKDRGKTPKIEWKIVDKAYPYKAGAKACDLCRTETMHIARGTKGFSKLPQGCVILNKKSEIMAKCPHKRKFSLAEAK